jgi:hypothetical protein
VAERKLAASRPHRPLSAVTFNHSTRRISLLP